jgi:hypothetical protein
LASFDRKFYGHVAHLNPRVLADPPQTPSSLFQLEAQQVALVFGRAGDGRAGRALVRRHAHNVSRGVSRGRYLQARVFRRAKSYASVHF